MEEAIKDEPIKDDESKKDEPIKNFEIPKQKKKLTNEFDGEFNIDV